VWACCTLSVGAHCECCALAAQVVGIMLGMLSLGFIADKVGRKWGSVACAAFMFVGGILLTASSAPTLYGWAVMFSVSQARSAHCVQSQQARHASPGRDWSAVHDAGKVLLLACRHRARRCSFCKVVYP